MADRNGQPRHPRPTVAAAAQGGGGGNNNFSLVGSSFLRKLHQRGADPTQILGFLTLIVSGGILCLLAGVTVTATVLGLILVTPVLILTSPIWFPIGAFLFVTVAGFLSLFSFGILVLGGGSWLYKYWRGLRPPGSDRLDYARSRIADTASHVKDYARGYGGYLQGKVKDAAPGA